MLLISFCVLGQFLEVGRGCKRKGKPLHTSKREEIELVRMECDSSKIATNSPDMYENCRKMCFWSISMAPSIDSLHMCCARTGQADLKIKGCY